MSAAKGMLNGLWMSAILWILIFLLILAIKGKADELPDAPQPQRPHLTTRPPHPDPPDESMIVHNWPNRAIAKRQDRLIDWSFILGHGIYAGALAFDSYETAKYVGGCASEGNPDLGSDPGNKRLVVHGLVELGAVMAGDALVKWAGRRNHVPRWMNAPLGLMAASIGTAKHVKGGMDWVRLCQ